MNWRDAAKRAVRTAAQAAAAVLVGIPLASFVGLELAVVGSAYLTAAFIGVNAGLISFLQNVGEDNSSVQVLPK